MKVKITGIEQRIEGWGAYVPFDFEEEFNCEETELYLPGTNTSWLLSIDLTPLAKCKNLQEIILSGNLLETLDLSPLRGCTNLQKLSFSSNQLSSLDLSPLRGCTNLEWLSLKSNQLSFLDLSPLQTCQNLERFYLKNNQLSSLEVTPLAGCTQLFEFTIDSDVALIWQKPELPFENLPKGLRELKKLQELYQQHP
ncbi:MAG: leucine-rich repeat protein [Candidatus Heimdallarchaeota archaeon]|nr:leucine-rich repeat protein [Candidatus Heimdallarchaeota archaeon]